MHRKIRKYFETSFSKQFSELKSLYKDYYDAHKGRHDLVYSHNLQLALDKIEATPFSTLDELEEKDLKLEKLRTYVFELISAGIKCKDARGYDIPSEVNKVAEACKMQHTAATSLSPKQDELLKTARSFAKNYSENRVIWEDMPETVLSMSLAYCIGIKHIEVLGWL